MKNLLYILFAVFFLVGCKKEEEEVEVDFCEENYRPLEIAIYTYGTVKHPFAEGVYFTDSETSVGPFDLPGLNSNLFTDVVVSVDGGEDITPGFGLSHVILNDISPGMHTISMTLNCTKEFYIDNQLTTYDCIDEENYGSIDVEFIEPTYIRIDTLIFDQFLPCDGANGSFCPDVHFDWEYYNLGSSTISNYYSTEDPPIQIAYGDTIAIYPSQCTIPIDIYDVDQFNDNDYLGNAEMNPTNMNGWTTGTHEIEPDFWIVITRLN